MSVRQTKMKVYHVHLVELENRAVGCSDIIATRLFGLSKQIQDPVTKNLVNMAFVHLVKRVHLEKRDLPSGDLPMLFFVTYLQGFFAEHDAIARTLEGEKVGAWFDGA
jgi:hypothetical protein